MEIVGRYAVCCRFDAFVFPRWGLEGLLLAMDVAKVELVARRFHIFSWCRRLLRCMRGFWVEDIFALAAVFLLFALCCLLDAFRMTWNYFMANALIFWIFNECNKIFE